VSAAAHAVMPAVVRRGILEHARRDAPAECCGFLLGAAARVRHMVPARNIAPKPNTRFRIDDAAHLALRRSLRDAVPPIGIVGIYHSHPGSAPVPSPTDLSEAWYPDWLYVIAGRTGRGWQLRAFRVADGRATPVRLVAGV
jgi:desampylase